MKLAAVSGKPSVSSDLGSPIGKYAAAGVQAAVEVYLVWWEIKKRLLHGRSRYSGLDPHGGIGACSCYI
jgi:hypothetical protein